MNSITINSKISFSELVEIIKNLPQKEKSKIKHLIFEDTYDIPEWQQKMVMERTKEYLKNPSIAIDFDKAISDIENEL